MKPGILTTEFWLTLAASGVAILALWLGLSPAEHQELGDLVKQAVIALAASGGTTALVWQYIASRTALKTLDSLQAKDLDEDEEGDLPPGGKVVDLD